MARRALIIDDDESVRFVLRNALADTGWQVAEIEDGSEAEDALKATSYSLIVLDLHMPGMNGFEVLRKLRSHDRVGKRTWKTRPDVPVLVISGHAEQAGLSFAERIGADASLTKPFEIADVQRIAHELEGRKRQIGAVKTAPAQEQCAPAARASGPPAMKRRKA
jgi:CheY-like chemotaxis protein